MKLRTFASFGALLALLVAVTVVQSTSSFDLWWHVVAGGGGQSASASYVVGGSIGQPAVSALSSTNYRLGAGFWPGIGVAPSTPTATPKWRLYLPLVLKSHYH